MANSRWKDFLARAPNEFNVIPQYGVLPFGAATTCENIHPYGPIPEGSHDYCECCSQMGKEGFGAVRRDAIDRNGNIQWPDPTITTSYEPGILPGGISRVMPKPARPSTRDLEWIVAHRGGVSVAVLANQSDVNEDAVLAGIQRAIFSEQETLANAAREAAAAERDSNEIQCGATNATLTR